MSSDLTKTLLLEEAASRSAVGEAVLACVRDGLPLLRALLEAGATTPEALGRYLARATAPTLRQVVPVVELVDRLPPGLPARLLAVPVRRDAITGTVDVAVADAEDAHPALEISYHLSAPVRLVRAPLGAIEDALRRLAMRGKTATVKSATAAMTARAADADDERLYDSRPRPRPMTVRPPSDAPAVATDRALDGKTGDRRGPKTEKFDLETEAFLTQKRASTDRHAHVVPPPARKGETVRRSGRDTPPWGTPVHNATTRSASETPRSGPGSEIPIPLMRRTFTAVSGGTQRPPPLRKPADSALGEGYPVDPEALRAIVEVRNERGTIRADSEAPPAQTRSFGANAYATNGATEAGVVAAFIPGPPPVPTTGEFAALVGATDTGARNGRGKAQRTQHENGRPEPSDARAEPVREKRSVRPPPDASNVLAAIRSSTNRDEVLDHLLVGARMVALRVGLFVVKRGGYQGWRCTTEFADQAFLQNVLVPIEGPSVFETAVRDGLYLGPVRHDEAHGGLLQVMRGASRDVAVMPVRVSGKAAVVIVADELGDTMVGTRRLEELAKAAGEAFTRILRARR